MSQLENQHPQLMVPHVFSFAVVLYTNGNAPVWPDGMLEKAFAANLPHGVGIGPVSCTNHGVYNDDRVSAFEGIRDALGLNNVRIRDTVTPAAVVQAVLDLKRAAR